MAAMQYRGPDNCTILEEFGGYTVGHCRLAIIGDPVLANQPMIDESGALLLVFNGEIYNYQELARTYHIELQAHSDTELLLALYALKGAACVSELNGMFSFVIVDRATHFCRSRQTRNKAPFLVEGWTISCDLLRLLRYSSWLAQLSPINSLSGSTERCGDFSTGAHFTKASRRFQRALRGMANVYHGIGRSSVDLTVPLRLRNCDGCLTRRCPIAWSQMSKWRAF